MAERYLYLPSLTAAILLPYFVFSIIKNRYLSLLLLLIITGIFVFATIDRNSDWQDEITLWEKTAETSPNTSTVFSNLGHAYEQKNMLGEANAALKKAVELDPNNAKAHYNLGIVSMREKKYAAASGQFLKAIELQPDYVTAYDSLGLTYYYAALQSAEQRDSLMQQAEASYRKAVALEPNYYKAYSDLGIAKAQHGNFTEAINLLEKSIRLNPWNHEAYYNLGIVYEFLNDKEKAKTYFAVAAELQPENALYQKKLANN